MPSFIAIADCMCPRRARRWPVELKDDPPVDCAPLASHPRIWEQKDTSTMLLPWEGERVVFLTPPGDFEAHLLARWVQRLDGAWALYADLTGAQPRPLKQIKGKPIIATVPDFNYTCGAGCGYLGQTGIELAMFYWWNYPALQRNPNAMSHCGFYEIGRNFYTFGDCYSCFTTGFAVFMRYVCMHALKCHNNDLDTRQTIEQAEVLVTKSDLPFLHTFTNADGLDEKSPRLKDTHSKGINPADQPVPCASAMLRLRREYGGGYDWVRCFFRALASCPTAPPDTLDGVRQQSWNWFLCASLAACKDLSPVFVDEWRLPLTTATRAALAKIDWKRADLTITNVTAQVPPRWQSQSKTASD